jgi:outer membrane lipoprotein-sorting protein
VTRPSVRWLPAAVVPAVIAAGALVGTAQAGADGTLPGRSLEQVLTMAEQSDVQALSGELEQTSELGLPQVPDSGPSAQPGAASVLDLLTGSHTMRVYQDGPAQVRLQVMDTLGERDVVRNGSDIWFYSSSDNAVTHLTLPAGLEDAVRQHAAELPPVTMTPEQLAHRLLEAADPTTDVSLGEGTEVAGRTAYELVLRPRTDATLVGSVSIAVDSATGLPLSVQVEARGQDEPAFRLAFTELSLDAPASDLFAFTPPPGATVTEHVLPAPTAEHAMPQPGAVPAVPMPTVTGTGWAAVVEMPAGAVPGELAGSPLLSQVVPGGRVLSTALVNVLLTTDGRVLAGSVPVERLRSVAGL